MIGEAMKAHDEVRVSTLRLLSSAFNYEKIERRHELTESEEEGVIRKEAKKRKDAVDIYKKATILSSSYTFFEGSSPFTILQKMQPSIAPV